MSYKAFYSSSVRRWCEPILVTTRTYIGQPADQYRLCYRRGAVGHFSLLREGETEPSRLGGISRCSKGDCSELKAPA